VLAVRPKSYDFSYDDVVLAGRPKSYDFSYGDLVLAGRPKSYDFSYGYLAQIRNQTDQWHKQTHDNKTYGSAEEHDQ